MLPHFHIDNEAADKAHNEHHHHGHTHHHHHEIETSVLDGFLNFLGHLGHHEHGQEHLDNYIANINSSSSIKASDFVKYLVVADVIINHGLGDTLQLAQYHQPPILYELQNSSSDPLRGPPSIA